MRMNFLLNQNALRIGAFMLLLLIIFYKWLKEEGFSKLRIIEDELLEEQRRRPLKSKMIDFLLIIITIVLLSINTYWTNWLAATLALIATLVEIFLKVKNGEYTLKAILLWGLLPLTLIHLTLFLVFGIFR